jgi:flagellar biosynthesis/type III secretory pathway protein FliH
MRPVSEIDEAMRRHREEVEALVAAARDEGYNAGYEEGREDGYDEGWDQGYAEGREEAGDD